MKSLIRSFVVGTVVGSLCFAANVAEAGPTYAQRQADQRRLETKRAAVKMENRFKIERKDLNDQMLDAIRRSQHQPATTLVPMTAPTPAPVRQDPYEPATSQPGTYQPTTPTTPTNAPQSDAQYKMSLQQTLANYDRLLDYCRANPGTTPEERASNDSLMQTILRARANVIGYLQNLENQGR
ncbi:MAG: hypothetical protein U0744_13135 [Gemmataceae bacterium]